MGGRALILLDRHAWIWWIDESDRLGEKAATAIAAAVEDEAVSVSAISCWEIAALVRKCRLESTMPAEDWIARCEGLPYFTVLPIDARTATRAGQLEMTPGDPANRLIVTTALMLGAALVTKDGRLGRYVETIW